MQRFLDSPANPGYPENPRWSVNIIENDIYKWNVVISGETDTIWENVPLRFKMSFGGIYPLWPPSVVFDPPIYHPNVRYERIMNGPRGDVGKVFIHLLLNSRLGCWDVNLTAKDVILKMRELLEHPDLRWDGQQQNVMVNYKAARLFEKDRAKYESKVRDCIAQLPPLMAPAPAIVPPLAAPAPHVLPPIAAPAPAVVPTVRPTVAPALTEEEISDWAKGNVKWVKK
jgi:ubiquitin-protein ligase